MRSVTNHISQELDLLAVPLYLLRHLLDPLRLHMEIWAWGFQWDPKMARGSVHITRGATVIRKIEAFNLVEIRVAGHTNNQEGEDQA